MVTSLTKSRSILSLTLKSIAIVSIVTLAVNNESSAMIRGGEHGDEVVIYTAQTAPLRDGPGTNMAFTNIRNFLYPQVFDEHDNPRPNLGAESPLVKAYNGMYTVFKFLKSLQEKIKLAELNQGRAEREREAVELEAQRLSDELQSMSQGGRSRPGDDEREPDLELGGARGSETDPLMPQPNRVVWSFWDWFKIWNLRIRYNK